MQNRVIGMQFSKNKIHILLTNQSIKRLHFRLY